MKAHYSKDGKIVERISLDWVIEDVRHVAEHNFPNPVAITDEHASNVLNRALNDHDADLGVSWLTLEIYLSELLEEDGVDVYKVEPQKEAAS